MPLYPADQRLEQTLRTELPERLFKVTEPRYLEEPRGRYSGRFGLLLLPETTEQVAHIVKAANDGRVGVVPYGGGTGLVGGQIALDGPAPVILSLERMTSIRAIYPAENVILVEAGCILADIQSAAAAQGRIFPLSLASEGSAHIGGNLATNAGGVNVLRYGNARDLCLGLEAVLPDGRIWHGLSRLRKDNTGYDLRNLMIGAEGTLGIITAAALKLAPEPVARGTAMIAVSDPQAALELLSLARAHLAEGISAFELIHRQSMVFLNEKLPSVRQPFPNSPDWMVLIDLGLGRGTDPNAALMDLFADAQDRGLAFDGVIASSEGQRRDLWAVRERIPEANRLIGAVSNHDISLPLSAVPEFIKRGAEEVAKIGDFQINCFGHLGDGNLHYNVFPVPGRTRTDHLTQRDQIKLAIHDLVYEMQGSVSAEHGIGRLKVDDLERYTDPVRLAAMRSIKDALDPRGIMNPGAILRSNVA